MPWMARLPYQDVIEPSMRATLVRLRGGKVTGEVDPTQESNASLSRLMIGAEPPQLQHIQATLGATVLEVKGLSVPKADPFATALSDIAFEVRAGEILGIAGVSGNGQQELMAALSGEDLRAPAGSIKLFGQDIAHDSPRRRRKEGLHFVPEERLGRGAVPTLSLAANTLLTRTGTVNRSGWIRSAEVTALDKVQGSYRQVTSTTAVKQDLVISAYKPNGGLEDRFVKSGATVDSAWDFVQTHLRHLSVTKVKDAELEFIVERDPRRIYDRLVAWFVRHDAPVPLSSDEFLSGLDAGTLVSLLARNAKSHPKGIAMRERDRGVWREFTWGQMLAQVLAFAAWLDSEGFKPGARAQVLGGQCWTAPVLANGLVYCRNSRGDVAVVDLRRP